MTATRRNGPSIGSVVTARPWQGGREIHPHDGIVVLAEWGSDSEYAMVWFPDMHGGRIVAGSSVQPIMIAKMGNSFDLSVYQTAWVRKVLRLVKAARRARDWQWTAAGFEIERAAASVELRETQAR